MKHIFSIISNKVATATGNPLAFLLALSVVVAWSVTGPLFDFSNTWQLVINTGTTIITFLMVFLIQNMQNRDGRAVHLKLDELIHSTEKARNEFVDLEYLDDADLEALDADFQKLLEREISAFTTHLHVKVKNEKTRRKNPIQSATDAIKKVANYQIK